jgi:hypothetical protein
MRTPTRYTASSLKPLLLLPALLAMTLITPSLAAPAASWIGPATSEVNQWTRYVKTFTLDALPASAEASIAVDSKYWLWLNGVLVIREGGLKRGPSPRDTYYDRVDLAPHLKPGENTLAVLVWHFGKHGFSHQNSGRSGLWFSLDLDARTVVSDDTWKLSPHPAIMTSPDTPPNGRLPESSLRFDARADEPDWIRPAPPTATWATPTVFGQPPCAPWGELVERPIPQWKDYGLQDYISPPALPVEGDGSVLRLKLPYNAQITPWLRVEARAGLEIDLRTDNFLGGGAPNIHAKYLTRDGVQEFEALGWMNGHEVFYTIPAGVKVLGLKYRETGYDAEFRGSFASGDPDLNLLWQKAARTLYITMRDTYMDCPDRERAQWWGDVVNELGEVFYTFDPRGSRLTRKAIHELVDWQRPDGTLYSPVPAGVPAQGNGHVRDGTWAAELPVQMLACLSKYGFWTYYLHSGDAATIRHAYPAVKRYLNLWQFDADGLIAHRRGGWDWSDWGENIDARVIDNAWYYLCMEAALDMARLTGDTADLGEWQKRRARIAENFNRVLWNGTAYRSPGYTGDTDDRANGLAVVAGLATPAQHPALIEVLTKHRNASPYMEKYVLEALFQLHQPALAMTRMKERYREQLDSPLTTLWEGWGIGEKGFGGGSYNHAWSGGPLTLLSQYAAGVAPTAPGYAAYAVLPQMGSLDRIAAVVPTVRGEITVALAQSDDGFTAEITSPPDCVGVLGIPKRPGLNLTLVDPAYQPVSEDEQYLRLALQPGHNRIEARFAK